MPPIMDPMNRHIHVLSLSGRGRAMVLLGSNQQWDAKNSLRYYDWLWYDMIWDIIDQRIAHRGMIWYDVQLTSPFLIRLCESKGWKIPKLGKIIELRDFPAREGSPVFIEKWFPKLLAFPGKDQILSGHLWRSHGKWMNMDHRNTWLAYWTMAISGWWFGTFYIFPYIGNIWE